MTQITDTTIYRSEPKWATETPGNPEPIILTTSAQKAHLARSNAALRVMFIVAASMQVPQEELIPRPPVQLPRALRMKHEATLTHARQYRREHGDPLQDLQALWIDVDSAVWDDVLSHRRE